MSNNSSERDILFFLSRIERDAFLLMIHAFQADSHMHDFVNMRLRATSNMKKLLNKPGFNRYSFEDYELIKGWFQPLHLSALRIAGLVADQQGIDELQRIGLVTSENFPLYRPYRTNCVHLWNQMQHIANTLSSMVFKRVREQEERLNNLLSLEIGKISEEVPTDTCAVCIENFAEGDSVISLPCKHKYHAQCVLSWLVRNPTCPMDRRNAFDVIVCEQGDSGASWMPRLDVHRYMILRRIGRW